MAEEIVSIKMRMSGFPRAIPCIRARVEGAESLGLLFKRPAREFPPPLGGWECHSKD
ncbi:Hypothetical protein Minf_2036 [Methylacidiphilum infernorum V4]|uniref:Uncharacterized protein n=1 Tax=Methylacidiphilum infernorum (isolate V4) TaxID=481448 RepID=B3DYP2_METI4|nr:Hypothetical protein Minf_2036 [Methylacidiphilum infernorum V4]